MHNSTYTDVVVVSDTNQSINQSINQSVSFMQSTQPIKLQST